MRLGAAWVACEMPAAIALSLSYDEVVTLTRKPVDRAEWDKDTRDFADERCREFAQSHAHILTATVVKTEHHLQAEDPERLKTDIDVTFVQFIIEQGGRAERRGIPLGFVRMPQGLKFMAKH